MSIVRNAVLIAALAFFAGCSDDTGEGWQLDDQPDAESEPDAASSAYEYTFADQPMGCCDIINIYAERSDGGQCVYAKLWWPGEDAGYDVEVPEGWLLDEIHVSESRCDASPAAAEAVAERAEGRIWFRDPGDPYGSIAFDLAVTFGEPIDETIHLVGER
ncbi:hypothetical protein FIV42_25535 [Persicimonas caeni]|uniref:Lipoprotein n=1 Tax=Persicimonas caeni TaxID=2292766 RepID=A0A4Y6Q0D3_PERCE|nr:hypothetical protein [Persicimonas caeni]QDG53982.1 hypothetical protein FIV42_25535 [Persicimonas caeni]QED35203.1 hypothetical protein FRD00_25530 [Persicimonas caeni]